MHLKYDQLIEVLASGSRDCCAAWIKFFENLLDADIQIRLGVARGEQPDDPEDDDCVDDAMRIWLSHAEAIRDLVKLLATKAIGSDCSVEDEELGKRISEAKWMLDPPDEVFDNPKFHELRDRAIEDLRAGNVEEF